MQTVTVSAGDIEIREVGSGPALLLLHGALVGWQLWEPVMAPLAKAGYRVVVPTLPLGAHSRAMRADADLTPPALARLIVELIDKLDLRTVTLVSNDTATALTQIVLTEHPGVVSRAVLTSGDAFRWFFPPAFRPLQALGYFPPLMRQVGKATRNARIRNSPLGFGLLTRRGISDDLGRQWTDTLIDDTAVRRDAAKVLRGVSTRHTMRAAKKLPEVDIPVLLLWAEDDRAFPMRLAKRLADLIPNARLVPVPDAATYVSLDAPDAVVAAIRDFVPRASE